MSDAQGTGIFWAGYPAVAGIWPIGDVYQLTPKWAEHHVAQGITCSCTAEAATTVNLCGDFGFPLSVDVTLTDLGDLTTKDDDVPATGYVRTESWITRDWGWNVSYDFEAEPVLDDDDNWTGVVTLTIPVETQQSLGFNQPWTYSVRVILATDPDDATTQYPVHVLNGYLVLKP